MKREIYIRVTEAAEYIRATGATVRVCAKRFGVSKTTIHKDMRERLKEISPALYAQVSQVLAKNKAERHIRGGEATRKNTRKRSKERSP